MGYVTWHPHFRDILSSVGRDLLCSTHILSLKLRLPATKKWRAMPNVKIFVLSHPLGDLGATHTVHLWLDGKRVVDFLLALIELFSLALTAAALLSEICRNWRSSTGVGIRASCHGWSTMKPKLSKSAFIEGVRHFERQFQVDRMSPAIDLWTVR